MFKQLKDLEGWNPTNLEKINSRKQTLTNAEEFQNSRENLIKAFENGFFPFKDEI